MDTTRIRVLLTATVVILVLVAAGAGTLHQSGTQVPHKVVTSTSHHEWPLYDTPDYAILPGVAIFTVPDSVVGFVTFAVPAPSFDRPPSFLSVRSPPTNLTSTVGC